MWLQDYYDQYLDSDASVSGSTDSAPSLLDYPTCATYIGKDGVCYLGLNGSCDASVRRYKPDAGFTYELATSPLIRMMGAWSNAVKQFIATSPDQQTPDNVNMPMIIEIADDITGASSTLNSLLLDEFSGSNTGYVFAGCAFSSFFFSSRHTVVVFGADTFPIEIFALPPQRTKLEHLPLHPFRHLPLRNLVPRLPMDLRETQSESVEHHPVVLHYPRSVDPDHSGVETVHGEWRVHVADGGEETEVEGAGFVWLGGEVGIGGLPLNWFCFERPLWAERVIL